MQKSKAFWWSTCNASFENPEDVLRVVEGGVPLKTINVGSMAHSTGKVQPNKVLAFNQEDIVLLIN